MTDLLYPARIDASLEFFYALSRSLNQSARSLTLTFGISTT
jgi:hypothetical protein